MESSDQVLGRLPEALKDRARAVQLAAGGAVIVEKWSLARLMLVADYVGAGWRELSTSLAGEKTATAGAEFAGAVVRLLKERLPGLLELCVREEDRARVTPEILAEDALTILEAVIELNEGGIKKAVSLRTRVSHAFAGNGKA